jgi:hypothetical protein
MRWDGVRYLAAVLLTMSTAAVLATPALAANKSRCERPKGASLVKANSTVAVYRRSTTTGNGTKRTWWACYRSSGRRTVVHRGGVFGSENRQATDFRVAGPYAAFQTFQAIRSRLTRTLVLFNVRSGKRVATVDVPESDVPIDFELRQFVLHSSGVMAWLTGRYNRIDPQPRGDTLQVRDSAGARVLDTGAYNTLAGLRVTATAVSWTNAGVARSAPVSGR